LIFTGLAINNGGRACFFYGEQLISIDFYLFFCSNSLVSCFFYGKYLIFIDFYRVSYSKTISSLCFPLNVFEICVIFFAAHNNSSVFFFISLSLFVISFFVAPFQPRSGKLSYNRANLFKISLKIIGNLDTFTQTLRCGQKVNIFWSDPYGSFFSHRYCMRGPYQKSTAPVFLAPDYMAP
jgi:hypothetical protein